MSEVDRNWNVHAHSEEYAALLARSGLLESLRGRIERDEFEAVLGEMQGHYGGDPGGALAKMSRRWTEVEGGYVDADLGKGMNVAILVVDTWRLVKSSGEVWEFFRECLEDVGGTCIQGDSHRVLNFWVFLRESEGEERAKLFGPTTPDWKGGQENLPKKEKGESLWSSFCV